MFKITDTHYASTWLLHENAPKVDMPEELRNRINRMLKEANVDVKEATFIGSEEFETIL